MIAFSNLLAWFRSIFKPNKPAFSGWLYEIEDQWSCEYGTSELLMMECGWPIDKKETR